MNSDESISIVMPVHNRQDTLASTVEGLLEILSELSPSVQLVLVDDGSTDGTPEIMDELRRRFPQVTAIRCLSQQGASRAVEHGMSAVKGDLVFTQESYSPMEWNDLRQLWGFRHDPELVMVRARTRTRRVDAELLHRLKQWGQKLEDQWLDPTSKSSELKMYRREVVENLVENRETKGEMEISHLAHRSISNPFGSKKAVTINAS